MKQKYFIFSFLGILLLSVLAAYLYGGRMPDNPVAEIYVDGSLYRAVPMKGLAAPLEIEIVQEDRTNTVVVTSKTVCMKSADCRDKLCVKQGAIDNGLLPIVCLPNRVTVKITGSTDHSGVDIISR